MLFTIDLTAVCTACMVECDCLEPNCPSISTLFAVKKALIVINDFS